MKKIAAIASTLLLASVYGHGQQKAAKGASAWPDIKYLTTFKSTGSVYEWDNGKLVPYQGTSFTFKLLVDGDRNKAMVRGRVQIPIYG